MKTYKIAADMIDGIYFVDYFPPDAVVIIGGIEAELNQEFDGVKYFAVNAEELQHLSETYGVY